MAEQTYGISRYSSRFDKGKKLKIQHLTWEQVVAMLTSFKVTDESFEDYICTESVEKLSIKDVGYFVGGVFDPPQRKTFNLVSRSLLTLDLDHLEPFDEAEIKAAYGKFAYVVHSSHSHSSDAPRLRIVFPLSREVTPEEYEPLARKVAEKMGMDYFDDTTYQYSRVMFLPSVAKDGETYTEVNEGGILSPDKILALYDDPEDFTKWPKSSREGKVRASAAQAENAYQKKGVIGAFNRTYSIPEAIEAFSLPYVESGNGEGRYSYSGGTSADGAVYYPDDGHLFSWHESDPAKGNHHAFDLVRLHKYAELVSAETDDTPIGSRPSVKAMQKLALGDESVMAELRRSEAEAFEDLTTRDDSDLDSESEDTLPKQEAAKRVANSYEEMVALVESFYHQRDTSIFAQSEELILELAVARLDPNKQDQVLNHFLEYAKQNNAKFSKVALRESIKDKHKQLAGDGNGDKLQDIQVEFIDNFLKLYYAGGEHLKRTAGQWWVFNGSHWSIRSDEYIKGQMADMLQDLRTNAKSRKKARELAAAVSENQTSSILGSLWAMFCSCVTKNTESVNEYDPLGVMRTSLPPAINCANGTLWFNKDGSYELRPHDPEDLFTSSVDVNYVEGAACPTWMKFCQDAFQKTRDPQDMQRHLEELMGYILNQSRDMRAWVLMYGKSGSGKSTIGDLILHMLGSSGKGVSMSNYSGSNSHATAGIIGKLVLLDDDFSVDGMLNDGFIKSVSTEKRMTANPKGKDEFDFVSRAVPVILSNSPPVSKDTSDALADRALVFPFKHAVPREQRDIRLPTKLRAEAEGILYRCARAFARLVKRGDWKFPADCTVAWGSWRSESNPILTFLTACVVYSPGQRVLASDVWDSYQLWMRDEAGDLHLRGGRHRNKFYLAVDSALNTERVGGHEKRLYYKDYTLVPGLLTDSEARAAEFEDIHSQDLNFLYE